MYSLQCEINKREIKGINYTGQTCRHSKWQIKEHEADSNLVFRKKSWTKEKEIDHCVTEKQFWGTQLMDLTFFCVVLDKQFKYHTFFTHYI